MAAGAPHTARNTAHGEAQVSTFDRLRSLWGRSPGEPTVVPVAGAVGESRTPLRERRRQPRPQLAGGLRALIVDDSPTIVAVLRKMLRQNGYEVFDAGDGEQGIATARAVRPDLVLLDIVLPGISGFEALRQLRRDPATAAVPVIMISGNAQATEQFYVQRIGADDFLRKPFSRAEVFGSIERLLGSAGVPQRQELR